MALLILDPGLQTLVVDGGRPAARSLGVPVGGPADSFALVVGNALAGNPPGATALEICLAGPTVQADAPLAGVVFGAPFALSSDRHRRTAGTTFVLEPGEVLTIGTTPRSMRAYLCVRGGFAVPTVLGSRSALDPLGAGAELGCEPGTLPRRFVRPAWSWNAEPRTLRALPGPQADWFDVEQFFNREFRVTPDSNRMGLRLDGPPLKVPDRELASEPVCPGSVQVTRDGRCIVLGVDGQTIGGYPKVAQVISADIDKLGQLRPGDVIRFVPVSLSDAVRIFRDKAAELRQWTTRLTVSLDAGRG
jgi:antagonist of KipI